MYCKYCGTSIDNNSTQCRVCGARIDIYDGGQSFFEDGEIDEWRKQPIAKNPVPKTEVRDAERTETASAAADIKRTALPLTSAMPASSGSSYAKPMAKHEKKRTPARRSMNVQTRSGGSGRRKKKSGFKKQLLANPNMIIYLCIAAALALVLIIVGIVAIINGGSDETDTTQEAAYSQTQAPEETDNSTAEPDEAAVNSEANSADEATEAPDSSSEETDEAPAETDDDILGDNYQIKSELRKEIDSDKVKVYIGNEEKSDEKESLYMINDTVYLPLDSVMEVLGYSCTSDGGQEVKFENGDRYITVTKGEKTMYKNETPLKLDGIVANIGKITYAPAESFLKETGFGRIDIAESGEISIYLEK